MASIHEKIDDFTTFAKSQVSKEENVSIDTLYDRWRELAFREEDALAVLASLRDLENGERGQPVEEFLADFDSVITSAL